MSKKAAIVISSDEDEAPKSKGKKVAKVPTKKRVSKNVDDSSNFEASATEDNEDDMEVDEDDEDVVIVKSKSKAKGKAKAKARSASSTDASESEATDSMDIDEPAGKKAKGKGKAATTKGKKRKTPEASSDDEDTKKPAKKQKRELKDPWKLKTCSKNKWGKLRAPPLEMFYFARKVVDEYTYLDGNALSVISRITAERHWVLSGTPPVQDFGALKTISAFLDIHLGVDDDGEGDSTKKKRQNGQTGKSCMVRSKNRAHSMSRRGEVSLFPRSS